MLTLNGLPPAPFSKPVFLTIGSFDGVHRGHQTIITRMMAAAHAAGCLAGVLTFEPHPSAVLRPNIPISYLTTPEERARLLAAVGADFVVILPFTRDTAATSAAAFMRLLVERLNLKSLWVGPDFALGRGREGDVERLSELGRDLGYQVQIMPPFGLQTDPVRSSHIRALLSEQGAVARAADLLGRTYQIWGTVQSGAGRGHTLGYPTANIQPQPGRLVPAYGIYACWAWLSQDNAGGHLGIPAAVSIGVRPTFDNGQATIEAYLIDFAADLYGKTLGLSFIERLRPELRFPNAAALVAQMRDDVSAARAILGAPSCDAGITHEGWVEVPHTADWAIRVRGDTQKTLFAQAAGALYTLQDADPDRPATLARAVSLSAAGAAELLVGWLNCLLLTQETGREMYNCFQIFEISDTSLEGAAYGYAGTPGHTGVKAVTFHDLDVHQTAEGWLASLTFDV